MAAKAEGNRRIKMGAADRTGHVNTKGDGQAPTKNDVGVAALRLRQES